MRRGVLLMSVVPLLPAAAWGQGGLPLGPEFRVNTYTTNQQWLPSVASDAAGNFVVVWHSAYQDGSDNGVFAQRYASTGAPLGPEFRVNTYTTNSQHYPAVAADASGSFVVVWRSDGQDGSSFGVFGQRYASTGAPLGSEFRVNTYTTNGQSYPAVAADASGNVLVVWTSDNQDGESSGIFGQRYSTSGATLGPEFRVNTYTTSQQAVPAVAGDPSGNFVVAWTSLQDGGTFGVFSQRYAGAGPPLGGEFQINTYTTGNQGFPAVATDSTGNFIVVWIGNQTVQPYEVFGQRYGASGAPLGPEFRVNTYTTFSQYDPTVATDAAGNFVVVWHSPQDGSGLAILGQRYAASGGPLGSEFRVNSYVTSNQNLPAVASGASGNFVVVWTSNLQDGSGMGVFGQRYAAIVPVELMRFGVE